MTKYINRVLLLLSLLALTFCVDSQKMIMDSIAFPEVEENINLTNKNNRHPVFIPSMCPVNELLYPGDQKDDWICDCRPGHLYHPKTDRCWPAFQRGPCDYGLYMSLVPNSVIPKCVINPCVIDDFVIWKGKCERIGDTAACDSEFPTKFVWVNATTLAIECITADTVDPTSQNQMSQKLVVAPTNCPLGCKRSIQNKC